MSAGRKYQIVIVLLAAAAVLASPLVPWLNGMHLAPVPWGGDVVFGCAAAVVVVVVLGAYLRWAAGPVTASYRLGTVIGRMEQAKQHDDEMELAYSVIGRLNRRTGPKDAPVSAAGDDEPFDGEPFDAEQFARRTVRTVAWSGHETDVIRMQVLKIEECLVAPWPRRWLLWSRLRREIRASVATFDDDHIARGNFIGRRSEWSFQQAVEIGDMEDATRKRWARTGVARGQVNPVS